MKFTTVSVLVFGAALTGVLAAPILKSGAIANVAAANIQKREAAAAPDEIQNGIFKIGLAGVHDPYWCGSPFCGKEKREPEAIPQGSFHDAVEPAAEPVADADVKLVKRPMGPPTWLPHPKCGDNPCQPYGRPSPPTLPARAITSFIKRQFSCGAPFCFGDGKA